MNSPQALGPSIRPQAVRDPATGYPKNDEIMPLLQKAIESYKEMADYGANLGIRVTLENHWGLAADPMNIRIIIDEVNNPYCEASPDFCNWEYDYMNPASSSVCSTRYGSLKQITSKCPTSGRKRSSSSSSK